MIINGRYVIGKDGSNLIVKCPICGKEAKGSITTLRIISCRNNCKNKRYSGRTYTNSVEKIEKLRNEYKNGVSKEIINQFVDELLSKKLWT